MMVFISGGVRSGKSKVAEGYARKLAIPEFSLHYIATASADDDEMKQRIIHHQKRREKQPIQWATWEQPVCLDQLVGSFTKEDVVLLDCLTNWLANELFRDGSWKEEKLCFRKAAYMWETLERLAGACKALIIVSNELFCGGVPADIGTYHYMKMLGWLHQKIVAEAEVAVLVQHGVATVKKGELF
ncbi:bifunctional adenosylcobinamide kinase/adenosylcobinamide-phosphate guanylyltransferase [Parageobacillus sp. VR-IP]|uniref:bifunctional adenosylcobinamide kinase/adenosylcobinamide-phosphate guanylyltransferase n=1 Tax=Parageobacillus sp. VR-IP TaxID=2742205 RepID=UPI001582C508|nr:bifunctional adenosylcobinamide kinase/adenosylcobinamide-phosphate guanylyltransferase [Parageobacillus sp. VR-IP]NUK31206.1 bifunctional adenosylcobinamide kinase/adenosylcobinamide-phosphate guanylyltransferase [Parageobacillus sp. VR-IP]